MWLAGLLIFSLFWTIIIIFALMSNDHINEDYEESMNDTEGIE